MIDENKICQNCKKDFVIESEDFIFYEKLKVPPPTFCFPCRLQRKLVFRNERGLYSAKCDLCEESTLSVVPNNPKNRVYCISCWIKESSKNENYGKDYDFSQNFFIQFKNLLHTVPVRALVVSSSNIVNSKYANTSSHLKNCYLIYGSDNCIDCMYGTEISEASHNCIDCMMISATSNAYEAINCDHCSNIRHCIDCKDSIDILYSKNLSGCSDCLGCVNLRNKKHCIFNVQFSKKDYFEKLKEYKLDTFQGHLNFVKESEIFFQKYPVKYLHGFSNKGCTGDYIYNSKNVKDSFVMTGSQNCKYCFNVVVKNVRDCMDYSDWGSNVERVYESQSCGVNISEIKFCVFVSKNSFNCEYSAYCANCQNIFGCVGLRDKEYYIFNKKYGKKEFFELKEKIINQMNLIPYIDNKGNIYKYGEFFPAEISLFPYNDTTAQDVFILNELEANEKGFSWSKRNRNYEFDYLFSDMPDSINDIDDTYINKIIMCQNKNDNLKYPYCTGGYKILEKEFIFYKKYGIPLPRFCFNCRYYQRLSKRNPLKLWHRKCMKDGCNNEFETSYAPERPEIVYCERCYQQEVY